MALRIGGPKAAPAPMMEEEPMPMTEEAPVPEEMPAEAPPAEEDTQLGEQMGAGTLDPATAVYRTPDMGPFLCANCQYFNHGENTCRLVAGPIDEDGVCNLFTPVDIGLEDESLAEDQGEEMAEQEPVEEPPAGEALEEEQE